MKDFGTDGMGAFVELKDSIAAAKARNDDGIYKIIGLNSLRGAEALAKIFFSMNYDVSLYSTGKPNHYGFFITWDD